MTSRIVDISQADARLSLSLGRLVVVDGNQRLFECPVREIAGVIVSNPRATISTALLAELGAHGVTLTVCNEKWMPSGWFLGLETNVVQSERLRSQISSSLPLRKRIWQSLIRAKIRAQAELLVRLKGDDLGISKLVATVRSGDSGNVEAQASRVVWRHLFAAMQPGFKRDPDLPGWNAALNYGYAILRGVCARAIAGAGLHPTIGVHHASKYNGYCLADDLMEPFRTVVECRVISGPKPEDSLSTEYRRWLASLIEHRVKVKGEHRTLPDAIGILVSSLVRSFDKDKAMLVLPSAVLPDA